MKKFNLMTWSVILSSIPACTTLAGEGSVVFNGSVLEDACIIDGADTAQIIDMGNISTSAFHSAGEVAAATRFSLSLSDCPQTVNTVSFQFSGVADNNNATLLSLDSGSTASGVAVAIYENDSSTLIPLYSSSREKIIDHDAGINKFDFVAKYMATEAKVRAGTANASAEFVAAYN